MDSRKHYRHRLSDEVAQYIEDYAIMHDLPYHSRSESLERIIREHMKINKEVFSLQYITDTVTEKVSESVNMVLENTILKEMKRVRLGTNNTDRNTQILIELLQGYMQMKNIEHIITTDILKPEFLTDTEHIIHERITNQKQRKDHTQSKGEI